MSLFSTFGGGGGDIPVGDKLRMTSTAVTFGAGDTTILNVASGGGKVWSIAIPAHTANIGLQAIKVTIDGATERTVISGGPALDIGTAGLVFPCPISFTNSCVVKINISSGTAGTDNVLIIYSVL